MRLISWNIARRLEAWRQLADSGADVALLQEAAEPPSDVRARVEVDDADGLPHHGIRQTHYSN